MKKLILTLSLLMVIALVGCGAETTEQVSTTESTVVPFDATATIKAYTRDTTSGTREAFFKGIDFSDAVDDNTELVSSYIEVSGNGAMMTSIDNDVNGIGYISLSTLEESGLNGLNFDGVEPTIANVLNDTYGLKRPFMYMERADWNPTVNGSAVDMSTEQQIVEAFIAFMGTVEGKAIISEKGGIVLQEATDPTWSSISANYSVCGLDNSSVTVKFGGSTSVEKVSKGLSAALSEKCGNFVAAHNHLGSGDAYKKVQGDFANTDDLLHIGFASRDFKDTEVGADGTFGQICWDAVVIVVNPKNTYISNITAAQTKSIFDGTVTTWDAIA